MAATITYFLFVNAAVVRATKCVFPLRRLYVKILADHIKMT